MTDNNNKRVELSKRMKEKGYITAQEAADQASVPLTTLYGWLDRNIVKNRKIGGGRYVHEESLKDYLK
jgi:excisionase family DNA binding protein